MQLTPASDVGYFASAGPTTDLRGHGEKLSALPSDPAALAEIVRGLLLHNWTAAMSGVESTPEKDGMAVFGAGPTIDRILTLDDRPLDQQRPTEERLIGFCYHFALLHCAFLRGKGTPARTRCGFANYFDDGKWIDHWIVEYWQDGSWRLNDPQIGLDDLSPNDFRDGVRAWKACRAGDAAPHDHGNGELWGWDELRGSLVNDLGSLNKVEVGDWGWCGLLEVEPLDQPHPAIDDQLDAVADLMSPDQPLDRLHAAFEEMPSIRPPADVLVRP